MNVPYEWLGVGGDDFGESICIPTVFNGQGQVCGTMYDASSCIRSTLSKKLRRFHPFSQVDALRTPFARGRWISYRLQVSTIEE